MNRNVFLIPFFSKILFTLFLLSHQNDFYAPPKGDFHRGRGTQAVSGARGGQSGRACASSSSDTQQTELYVTPLPPSSRGRGGAQVESSLGTQEQREKAGAHSREDIQSKTLEQKGKTPVIPTQSTSVPKKLKPPALPHKETGKESPPSEFQVKPNPKIQASKGRVGIGTKDSSSQTEDVAQPYIDAFFSYEKNQTTGKIKQTRIADKLTYSIDRAQKSICIAIYDINDYTIEEALLKARQRGIEIRIIMDKNALYNYDYIEDILLPKQKKYMMRDVDGSSITNAENWENAGMSVKVFNEDKFYKSFFIARQNRVQTSMPHDNIWISMHHKYAIIDNSTIWTGSFNFTRGGRYNQENTIIMTIPRVTKKFEDNFKFLWEDYSMNLREFLINTSPHGN